MPKYPMSFWILMSVCFVNSMAQMITVFISLFLHKHGFTVPIIGILISVFGVGGVLGGMLGGVLSDYSSPMRIARMSSLINALLIILFVFCDDVVLMGLNIFLLGLFNSLFRPASLLLILVFDKINKPSIIMSYRRVFVNLGISIGVMSSGVLFDYNERSVFILNALFVLMSFIALFFLDVDLNDNQIKSKSNGVEYKSQITYKLYYAMLCLIFGLFAYDQQQTIYGIYLNDYLHIDSIKLAMLFAINGFLVVIFQIPLTHFVRNISPFILSSIGGALIGFGVGLVMFKGGYTIALLSVFLWSMGELLLFPSAFDIILKFGSNRAGRNMSLYQTTFSISSLISPFVGALIYGVNVNATWYVCIILGIFSFIGFLSLSLESKAP